MSFQPDPRHSWSRTSSRALRHMKHGVEKYDLHATNGGFLLMSLATGSLWFISAESESSALMHTDQYIYPEESR